MKTVKELHIEFNEGMQNANSDWYEQILPPQIDLLLNNMQDRYVKQRIDPKSSPKKREFSETSKDLMDIQTLITPWTSQSIFTDSNDREIQYFLLPEDFAYPINQTASLIYSCGNINESNSSISEYRADVEFKDSTDAGTYFKTLVVKYDLTNLFVVTDYFPNGISTLDEKYRIINLILEVLNKDGVKGSSSKTGFYYQVYWEKYGGEYIKNKFIFISYVNTGLGKSFDFTESAGPVTDSDIIAQVTKNSSTTVVTTVSRNSPMRIYEGESIEWSRIHPYSKTNFASPLAFLQENILYVYRNNEFITNSVKLNYIRRPRRVDLFLERSCELSPEAQKEIVNMAVTNCLERVEARRYKTSLTENKFNE